MKLTSPTGSDSTAWKVVLEALGHVWQTFYVVLVAFLALDVAFLLSMNAAGGVIVGRLLYLKQIPDESALLPCSTGLQ